MTPDELLLNAGIDGELDAERSMQLQARIANDPAFKAAWERQGALKAAIRAGATPYKAPAALRARLMHAISQDGKITGEEIKAPTMVVPPRTQRRSWMLAAGSAVAASLATVLVMRLDPLSFSGRSDDRSQRSLDDAVTGHARALLAQRLVEVESSNQHTVRPWLSTRLSFSPTVPDLSAHGFDLVGARRDLLDGQTCAVLIYTRRQHFLSVFVVPADAQRTSRLQVVRGFNVIDLAHAGMAYWLVSDLNVKELGDFAELLLRTV